MRIRSGYSFKTGYGHLKDVASRLEEIGWKKQPISDRASTFAFNAWSKKVPHPVYGVELGVTATLEDKKAAIEFWTFFAKDRLEDLNRLVKMATSHYVREPALLYAKALAAEGVIKIAGEWAQLDHLNPKAKDFYIALSPATPRGLFIEAKKRGFRFIATSENYYPRETDQETYRIALGRRSNTQTYPMHILSDDEWHEALDWVPLIDRKAAIKSRDAALKSCNAKLENATLVKPQRPATLRELCLRGAKRVGVDLKNKVYAARLERELQLIKEKDFEDYFFIIADIIEWAKERMMVGPARGSSCGSLVCYLLEITTIDPIKYDLIFERFIDINRSDLPDIDIDFSDAERHRAFEYVEKKYGRERTARLGTVGMFRPRSALNAAAKTLQIPQFKVEKVLDSLIQRSSGDSRALSTLEDTLKDTEAGRKLLDEHPEILLAAPLEGHPVNSSQHAAGVIITEKPIETYVAIDARDYAAMCDKKDAEDLGMLKIDMLGLTQLSVFERALELAGIAKRVKNNGIRLKDGRRMIDFFNDIPLDDPKAFAVLNRQHYAGVFQFNGLALQSIAKYIETNSLEDIISMTALARPGPMASRGTDHWVWRRIGKEQVTYPHPIFKPYIENTLGIVTYQEQVMQIGREVGDLSWDDVTQLRKAMSKSLGKEYFDRYGNRWKENAIKKGVPKETAESIWDDLCAYGSWAFNRAHAVAYGVVSYWCCWLKAYYPSEFAAATLDAEPDPMKQLMLLRELHSEGINYVPVDLEYSTDRWTINKDGVLVGPLTAIKGVGPAAVMEVIEAREKNKALRPGLAKKLADTRTQIDSLYPVSDKIAELHPDLTAINIHSKPQPIMEVQPEGRYYQTMVMGVVTKVNPRDENEAVKIAKRGGRIAKGQTASLNLWIRDDTDEVFCKIRTRKWDFLRGKYWAETLRVGKSLIAVKGTMQPDFRMIDVERIRYLGEMDGATPTEERMDEAS